MMMGPHSPIGNQSLVSIAEDQADYAMWWINRIRDGEVIAAAPSATATTDYNEEMKSAMPQVSGQGWLARTVSVDARSASRTAGHAGGRGLRRPHGLAVTAATLEALVIRATQVVYYLRVRP
jgi:hypothetical protein